MSENLAAGVERHADRTVLAGDAAQEAHLRADARRNLELVLGAAEELFAEEGEAVSMEAIAKRAGVGVGTIYRRFPTKAALGEAVIVNELNRLADEVTTIAETASDERAFEEALARIVDVASCRRDLKVTLMNVGVDVHEVVRPSMEKMHAIVADLLLRAQRAGSIRLDVTEAEIVSLVGAACSASEADGGPSPLRLFAIIADGLRTTRSTL